ncbi:hypothetical protein KFK09_009297 [Dendrobium nobile]|uniref:X8 domain-containing protein n=1 Tax=Dendrobium nobile TaxID=94219 RepID=A0A8T3BSA3_DENNO|nr:hypothetical protein KFK09_009297 [Dendrobium nobile]
MEVMVLFLLLLAMPGGSGAAWCTCRPDANDPALQKTIDFACGAGADCNPILQNGACYNPNTVLAHCSYAANSYYQRNNQAQGACDFTGTATVTPTDPSSNGCIYPATSSAASSASGTATSTQNPASSSPNSLNPTQTGTGVLGGLGPSGINTNIDDSAAAGFLSSPIVPPLLLTILLLFGLVFAQRS